MVNNFSVKFWGVRGSIACPGGDTLRYGGNTSCVEVRCGEHLLVLDAGTGLKNLGNELIANPPKKFHLLLSHTHLDHVNGFPFFKPAYHPDVHLSVWAGHLRPESHVREQMENLMAAPLFPVGVDIMSQRLTFHDFDAGETLNLYDGVEVKTCALNHPNRATGYRIEYGGRSVCYVTDTEHDASGLDEAVLGLIDQADIFIYDSNFTDAEYPNFKGWGHSTWQQGVKLAKAAGVKTYVAFHHDPSHDDSFMDGVAAELSAVCPGAIVAREGMVLNP